MSKYSLEIWSPSGTLLADFAGIASGRKVTLGRNVPDQIIWNLDLNAFEDYARASGVLPSQLLIPGQSEVRVRRGLTYLAGGQVDYVEPIITAASQTLQIRATGFLGLFKDRYTAPALAYTGVERTTIAWNLISASQTATANSDFGITLGPNQATIGAYTVQYNNQTIKDALTELTKLQAAFDMEFTPDKKFNTYAAIGSRRPELVFEYPGNIKSLRAPLDGQGIANRLYLLGAGIGSQAISQIQMDDTSSQINYKVREKNVILSAQLDTGTLQDYGRAQLAAYAYPFELPIIQVNGNIFPFVTDYHIGDYVTLKANKYQMVSQINGLYRLEQIDLVLDDNDNEDVTLTTSR